MSTITYEFAGSGQPTLSAPMEWYQYRVYIDGKPTNRFTSIEWTASGAVSIEQYTYDPSEDLNLAAIQVNGSGFSSSGGAVTGGSISSFDLLATFPNPDVKIATVTFSSGVDAAALDAQLRAGSLSGYYALIALLDDDTFATGGSLNDGFEVGAGNDTVNAGDGEDLVSKWKGGNLSYNGGAGNDWLEFQTQDGPVYPTAQTQNLVVNLQTGVGQNPYGGTLALTSVENIVGTSGFGTFTSDQIIGSDVRNIIGDGLYDGGNDIVDAAGGDDLVRLSSYTASGASYHGGAGTDELQFVIQSYFSPLVDSVLDLATPANNAGVFQGVSVTGFETFTVANGFVTLRNFTFRGDSNAQNVTGAEFVSGTTTENGRDFLYGGGGGDTLDGLSGRDVLDGGDGNDRLIGGQGIDVLDGGADVDTADYSADAGAGGGASVSVYLSSNIAIDGFGATDTLISIENVIGTDVSSAAYNDVVLGTTGANVIDLRAGGDIAVADGGADVILGGIGTDALYGGDGDDTLVGGDFTSAFNGEIDYLFGDAGNDVIYTGTRGTAYIEGGTGNDVIVGGSGTDYVISGAGSDYVVLGGGVDLAIIYAPELIAGDVDTYADFTDGQDFIFMSASLAATTAFGDGAGFAYMAVSVAGGTHYTFFSGSTAAQVSDQVYFNL